MYVHFIRPNGKYVLFPLLPLNVICKLAENLLRGCGTFIICIEVCTKVSQHSAHGEMAEIYVICLLNIEFTCMFELKLLHLPEDMTL